MLSIIKTFNSNTSEEMVRDKLPNVLWKEVANQYIYLIYQEKNIIYIIILKQVQNAYKFIKYTTKSIEEFTRAYGALN